MNDSRLSFWESEYLAKDIPSSRTFFPSSVLKKFFDEKGRNVEHQKALDLGAGNLRNSVFLAELGFDVTAVEWVKQVTKYGIKIAKEKGVESRIHVVNQSLAKDLRLPKNHFDLVIDMMVLHSLDLEARTLIRDEVFKLLKQGGLYLLFTIGAEGDEFEKLIAENPGDEPNSYKFKHNGFTVTEKAFTQDEIKEFFNGMTIQKFERIINSTKFGDKNYERIYYFFVFQKL